MYYLGIDLGGTNIAAGVVNENYEIIGRGKMKTNAGRSDDLILDDMAEAARMAVKDAGLELKDIASVGVGSPGSVNPYTGVIATSNNLGFSNLPMGKMLKERLGFNCYLENDASAAAYGEVIAGGANLAGGELGHTVIVMDGAQCTCGRKGCWEAYASATGLIHLTQASMQSNKNSVMWELAEGKLENVNGRTAFDAMRKNDEAGRAVVELYIRYVACGLINTINTFQPEIICIGGGISKEGDNLLIPIQKIVEAERFSKNLENQTQVKIAKLGNDAGIIGAAFIFRLYQH